MDTPRSPQSDPPNTDPPRPDASDTTSSRSLDASSNPFEVLKSRYLIFGTFLTATLGIICLYALISQWPFVPSASEDPIATPILTLAVFSVMVMSIFWVGRSQGLKVRYIFGTRSPRFSILRSIVLVLSLLLFSLGISSLVLYLLSLSFPGYVEQLLKSDPLIDSTRSEYPRLYEALTVFWLLIFAPVVEELLFRGILLQRWSVKWGLRMGVLTSSILFGILHTHNPIGLSVFGLAMGLLYVRTHSLWVPIACHSLNNLAGIGIEWLSQVAADGQVTTVEDIQELWWMSLILVAVSLPFLGRFVWHSWPKSADDIPYVLNISLKH